MLTILRRAASTISIALLALAATAVTHAASGPVRSGSVVAELVARDASIQPGTPFWVALKLDHDEHWHSYWITAGTGYPTSIDWKLPDGFTAGPIVWPAPHKITDATGAVTGNGYSGRVYLFTQITPPASLAPDTKVTLKAHAEWLMCMDVCMPGSADVELTIPAKPGAPEASASATAFNAALDAVPAAPADWTITATNDGGSMKLHLAPKPGNTRHPTGLHFFDENDSIDYAAAQPTSESDGSFTLTLTPTLPDATNLKGILVADDALLPSGGYAGVAVDVPFTAAISAAAPPSASGPTSPSATASTTAGTPAASGPGTLAGTLFLAFLGGLVLNLMPCVFPILGIKIMGFVNQAGSDRRKVVAHGLAFTVGVLVSFWILAGLLLALRAGGEQLGWGFQLQSPAFVFGMAVFLLIFALNLSGVFEVGLSATGAGAGLQQKEGLTGSFFTGGLATLVATPCSAPFLAPALGAALAMPAVESILVFTAIAVGLSTPYLLLSIFPQAIRILPRPGAWMETFKQFMAFPLYATVGWLLWVLAAQTSNDDYALLMIAFAFVLIAMAAWFYGRFGQSYGKRARQIAGRVAALAALACGLWIGWPSPLGAATTTADANGHNVTWEKWSPEAIASARAAGRYVYVDFTARWCATCQTNKAVVFSSADVLEQIKVHNVLLLRGDWTNKDPAITAELAKWNRSAVPFNLLYAPDSDEPKVLPELLTPGIVLQYLAQTKS